MPAAPVVLIAALDRLAGLIARVDVNAELMTFADSDTRDALGAITEHRPSLVVLERFFATTPRGAALIERINEDPTLGDTEIRILSHDTDHARTLSPQTPAEAPDAVPGPALDYRGTRRAERYRLRGEVTIKVDGDPARVIDMSRIGAQVVLVRALRPYQRVRVALDAADGSIRCVAAIAWCRYELQQDIGGGYYRAGIAFDDVYGDALSVFCEQHAEPTPATNT